MVNSSVSSLVVQEEAALAVTDKTLVGRGSLSGGHDGSHDGSHDSSHDRSLGMFHGLPRQWRLAALMSTNSSLTLLARIIVVGQQLRVSCLNADKSKVNTSRSCSVFYHFMKIFRVESKDDLISFDNDVLVIAISNMYVDICKFIRDRSLSEGVFNFK